MSKSQKAELILHKSLILKETCITGILLLKEGIWKVEERGLLFIAFRLSKCPEQNREDFCWFSLYKASFLSTFFRFHQLDFPRRSIVVECSSGANRNGGRFERSEFGKQKHNFYLSSFSNLIISELWNLQNSKSLVNHAWLFKTKIKATKKLDQNPSNKWSKIIEQNSKLTWLRSRVNPLKRWETNSWEGARSKFKSMVVYYKSLNQAEKSQP